MVSNWFSTGHYRFVRNTPQAIDLDMMRKMQSEVLPPTKFYDGTTHLTYLRPSRVWENWFCQSILGNDTLECTSLIIDWYNSTMHDFKTEVLKDPVTGRSLHAAEDIPKGSFINADDTYNHLHIDAHQWEGLNKFVKDFPEAKLYKGLVDFFVTYGFQNEPAGLNGWSVSVASTNTFTNHGCTPEQRNVMAFPYSEDKEVMYANERVFGFIQIRRPQLAMSTGALRDIKKGEALMMDYSEFRSQPAYETEFIQFLDNICSTGVGLVDSKDGSFVEKQDDDEDKENKTLYQHGLNKRVS